MKAAALEVEVFEEHPGELHIYPRETRRGKAQWAAWIKVDGSGTLFVNNGQIKLPKNGSDVKQKPSKTIEDLLVLCDNGEEFSKFINSDSGQRFKFVLRKEKVWCDDTACSLKDVREHEFGKGCRLF